MNLRPGLLKFIGPGLLVAATGVGAGDLATASFTGSQLGTAVLWAVVLGGFFKFVLNEGLARWQLATGTTFLEGAATHLGKAVGFLFLPYLVLWSFFVGSALMSACGATLHAIFPVFDGAATGKLVFGILSSLVGLALVLAGGYSLFEKVMRFCIGLMFVTVVVTAALTWPGTLEVVRGLFIPAIPHADGEGISWTIALMGGVGGTVTVLCYGYWIAEEGLTDKDSLSFCRIDLGVGYLATIIFGIAMVIIGSRIKVEGTGAGLLVTLADSLQVALGASGRWIFLAGAFGAVFSSLLGVWQSVPYLFADVWRLLIHNQKGREQRAVNTRSRPYRLYLLALAFIPMIGLLVSFRDVQKLYAIIGAAFMPLLALALLLLNSRGDWTGELRNHRTTQFVLLAIFLFFGWMAMKS
jgi:Mn2+/Fe2+ NRAMP family transporter